MSRVARSIAALALAAVALPGAAYVRETTTPGKPESGVCLWWRSRAISYQVNATRANYTPCGASATAEAAVAAGLAVWSEATKTGDSASCTDFHFVEGAPTTKFNTGNDGVNLVVFRTKRCSEVVPVGDSCMNTLGKCGSTYNCWDDQYGLTTIGFTTTTFDTSTGEIFDADMELFGWDGTTPPLGHYFTCDGSTNCSAFAGCQPVDVSAVATHEAGHMLGLDHVCQYAAPYDPPTPPGACDPSAVMYPQVGMVSQRGLSQDDVAGICKIYPKGAGTLTCVNGGTVPEPPSHKSGGCSSAGGSGLAGVFLAIAFAMWRQRRRCC